MGDEGESGASLRDQAIDWLVKLDGGTADRQAFEAWRNADPRHASAFAQVAATWRRTADQRLSLLLASPASRSPEPERKPEPDIAAPAPPMVSRRAIASGCVGVALSVGAAGAFLAWPQRAFAATVVGERRTIDLPDGSQAMLNTDTQVAWRFGGEREFWVERGEAAMLVRGAAAPFRAYGAEIDARLSGGSFNLRLERTGAELMVLAGWATAAFRGAPAQTVAAGSVLRVGDSVAGITRLPPGGIATATAWQRGDIVFDGMPLGRAISEFNRYLPTKIVLGDADLATTRLGGQFRIAAPDDFLLALKEGFGIDNRRQDGRILLFRRGTSRP